MQDIGKMVANLVEGKLLLMRHAIDNRYLFVKRDSRYADNKTVGGLFQFYWTKLMAEWLSSRPEIDPICPSDDDQVEEFIASVRAGRILIRRRVWYVDNTLQIRPAHKGCNL